MASPTLTINDRYQLGGSFVGEGGMGLVYKAYDLVTKRHVALKTMRGPLHPTSLELFSKEWSVLAQISHPNIVDVLDTGEFEQGGERKPFFVMPFLPGATLEQLLQNASPRLTPERVVSIVSQTCRGLQAAHERGLIHRDLKPSNIFVMDDDAVKIIDFGIVHLAGAESINAMKGTLQYMAPEQIALKPCSPASDIYAVAVVCYEALTGRKPFARKTETETVEAIRSYIPPPICDINPLVTLTLSRAVHKAMAKDPYHRFSSAREFSETLQKALNGETIERFDRAKIQPRIERAKKAHAEGDHQFASEIIAELEAEGNIDPEMSLLRIQINQAVRQKSVRQLLDSARTRLEEDEFPLALQKIQEVLAIEPDNPDAVSLRNQIEKQRNQHQRENWFRLADQHVQNRSFGQARQGLQEILKLNPTDTRARELLVEVDRKEQEVERLRGEKEQLYQSAVNCYQRGEISSALTKLERILDVNRRSPDSAIPDRDAQYQTFYNQVRNEKETIRNAYAEGRRHLADRNFGKALEICKEFLKKSPGDPMFQALQLEVEEQIRQEQSAFIAEVSRRVEAEPDLDRRVNILKESVELYPEESHLQQSLRLVRERRDLVNSIVGRARQYEERGQFGEALSQFDILRNIYAQYPGLEFETERLKRRRDDQVRNEAKFRWVEQIDRHIALGDYARARDLVRTAMSEFPDDRELAGLERLAEAALKRAAEAEEWLQRGQKLCFDRQFAEGLEALQNAASLDNRNAVIRSALLNALVEQARSVLGQDWRAAEPLIEQALHIDGGHPLAKSLQGLVLDYKRQEMVNDCISQAREMQVAGDLRGALAKVEAGLGSYPNEVRLVQLRSTLQNLGAITHAAVEPAGPAARPAPVQSPSQDTQGLSAVAAGASAASGGDTQLGGPTELFTVDRSIVEPVPGRPKPVKPVEPRNLPNRSTIAVPLKAGGGHIPKLLALLQSVAEPKGGLSKLQWAMLFLAPAILLAAALVTFSHRPSTPVAPAAITEFLVDLQSNVLNTKFLVDGNPATALPLRLKPGSHKVEAIAAGYKPGLQTVNLGTGSQKSNLITFQLESEPIRVRLSSDLMNAKIALDGQGPMDLQDGGFGADSLALSMQHKLALLQSGKETLTVTFAGEPGELVSLAEPVMAKDVRAIVISALSSRARVYASDASLKGGLKDQPTQPIPVTGLELSDLSGNAEFVLDDGKSGQSFPIDLGNAPSLAIWLANDPNQGTLQIEASVPDADLFIDGRKRRALRSGKNYYGLEPGTHTIRVAKNGYEAAAEQRVELKKGERLQVPLFELRLIPTTASLSIEGGQRDAEVLIDGLPAGVIGPDGSFKKEDISPEDHTISLRKADFDPKQLPRTFTAGQTVRITGPDAQLTPFGILNFRVTTPGASLSYRRADDSQTHPAESGRPLHVRAGRYLVTATADGYLQRQETVNVEAGVTVSADWALNAIVEPKKAAPVPKTTATKDLFRDSANWKLEGNWWIHRGDDVSWFLANQGVYVIEFWKGKPGLFKRNKKVQWVIDQKSSDSRIEYSYDFSNLERHVYVSGKDAGKARESAPAGPSDSYTLEFEIGPESIVIRNAQGKELNRYQRPNASEPLGRFGIRGEAALVVKRVEER